MRVKRWWESRKTEISLAASFVEKREIQMPTRTVLCVKVRKTDRKSHKYRSWKCEVWVLRLEQDLVWEFDCFQKFDLKFFVSTSTIFAKTLFKKYTANTFHKYLQSVKHDLLVVVFLHSNCVHVFMCRYYMVFSRQTCKFQISPKAQTWLRMAYFYGV